MRLGELEGKDGANSEGIPDINSREHSLQVSLGFRQIREYVRSCLLLLQEGDRV